MITIVIEILNSSKVAEALPGKCYYPLATSRLKLSLNYPTADIHTNKEK
jgi:hypothetical protein